MGQGASDEVVLITGFPGLQARKLCEHILAVEPETRVRLVVLRKLAAQAERALGTLPPPWRQRVAVLEGDAAAMDLGLSGGEFRQLAGEVDRIHHVAHVSFLGVEEDTAAYANVQGAVEVVELARATAHLRCLVHHSTAQVSGDRKGMVLESELDRGQGFHNAIERTRLRAEQVMRRAMADVPIVVVRPTILVGDSGTGEADRFDGPYLLVLLILGLPGDVAVPLPEVGDSPLNIVPVDFVAKAAHHIGRRPDAPGTTVHLATDEPLTARHVVGEIARAGGRRTVRSFVPPRLARALLRAPGVERLVRSPRAFIEQLSLPVRYDTRAARALLAGSGIECPPFASYVDNLVTAAEQHLRQRRLDGLLTLDEAGPVFEEEDMMT
ncbi:MAG: SDR family oxidoreductase [Deltaproteobacteria bacterium]|nr:SDR family oxidoreductase [Deltaproteobacteria bacterium]